MDDFNLGLEHMYGKYDVVHCRFISGGVCGFSELFSSYYIALTHMLAGGDLYWFSGPDQSRSKARGDCRAHGA